MNISLKLVLIAAFFQNGCSETESHSLREANKLSAERENSSDATSQNGDDGTAEGRTTETITPDPTKSAEKSTTEETEELSPQEKFKVFFATAEAAPIVERFTRAKILLKSFKNLNYNGRPSRNSVTILAHQAAGVKNVIEYHLDQSLLLQTVDAKASLECTLMKGQQVVVDKGACNYSKLKNYIKIGQPEGIHEFVFKEGNKVAKVEVEFKKVSNMIRAGDLPAQLVISRIVDRSSIQRAYNFSKENKTVSIVTLSSSNPSEYGFIVSPAVDDISSLSCTYKDPTGKQNTCAVAEFTRMSNMPGKYEFTLRDESKKIVTKSTIEMVNTANQKIPGKVNLVSTSNKVEENVSYFVQTLVMEDAKEGEFELTFVPEKGEVPDSCKFTSEDKLIGFDCYALLDGKPWKFDVPKGTYKMTVGYESSATSYHVMEFYENKRSTSKNIPYQNPHSINMLYFMVKAGFANTTVSTSALWNFQSNKYNEEMNSIRVKANADNYTYEILIPGPKIDNLKCTLTDSTNANHDCTSAIRFFTEPASSTYATFPAEPKGNFKVKIENSAANDVIERDVFVDLVDVAPMSEFYIRATTSYIEGVSFSHSLSEYVLPMAAGADPTIWRSRGTFSDLTKTTCRFEPKTPTVEYMGRSVNCVSYLRGIDGGFAKLKNLESGVYKFIVAHPEFGELVYRFLIK